MKKRMDLNADLGEGGTEDAGLLGLASSANVACGGHAGDAETMRRVLRMARELGVRAGAHPGYEDRDHFGRRPLELPAGRVREMLRRQLEDFRTAAAAVGAAVAHVKPHGALYNQADESAALAETVAAVAREVFPEAVLFGPPGGELERAAGAAGLGFVAEGFADRRYRADGSLVPRAEARAVIDDVAEAVEQACGIALRQEVRAVDGCRVRLPARTLCVHGDGAEAVALLGRVRAALEAEGFEIGR